MAAIKEEITPEIVTPHFMDTDADGDLKPEIKLEIEIEEHNLSSVHNDSIDISDLKRKNPKKKTYYCGLCKFQASSTKAITMHNKTLHIKNGKHICPVCSKKFQRKFSLTKHLVKEHKNEVNNGQISYIKKMHKCIYCDYQTYLHDQLATHMTKHGVLLDDVPKYRCDQCGFETFTKCNLTSHKKIHLKRGKPYQCSYCDQGFYLQKHFDFHILTYHPEKRDDSMEQLEMIKRKSWKKYTLGITKCEMCEFKSNSRQKVRTHIKKIHANFRCEACNKTFISVITMELHFLKCHRFEDKFLTKLTHKVLECKKCTYMTLLMTCMRRHIRTHY